MFSQEWKDHYETKELVRVLKTELEEIKEGWVSGEYSPEKQIEWFGKAQAIRLVLGVISYGEFD
jgi:hypothetical protein